MYSHLIGDQSLLNLELSLFFADISFLGVTFLPTAWFSVVMIYTSRYKLYHMVLPTLMAIPILTNVIIWTNPLHGLWRGVPLRDLTTTWFPISMYNYGEWFYVVHMPFSIGVGIVSNILLVRAFMTHEHTYRRQIGALLVAINLPLLVEILYQLGISIIPHFNVTVFFFPISGGILAWALLRRGLLDLTPIARDIVVESMTDLMVILDKQQRIIDVNPAARRLLFGDKKDIIGHDIHALLPEQTGLLQEASDTQSGHTEIELEQNGMERIYEVHQSLVTHPSGDIAGLLLLLRDVTDRRKAEDIFFEQARQVARMEERQRLARDLHDSVTQTLFAASTLADLLPRALEKKPEKVKDYAHNIQQLIQGTNAEMRLVLLELYPDALTDTDLGTIIQHLCDAYTGSTGTPVNFSTTAQIHLDEDSQLVFYRVAQEALNNISKHTEASQVIVKLTKGADSIELVVQDNGDGFDITTTPPDHFGLSNMVERAKDISAVVYIISTINEGTTIKLVKELS